jgi:putative FmdB family regulatory protein
MPTYDYRCDACAHAFEAVQRFEEAPLATCPICGGPVRRVFTPPPIIFKGSGWYATDSKRSSTASGAGSGAKKAGEAAASGDNGAAGEGSGKAAEPKEPKETKESPGTGGSGPASPAKAEGD